MKHRTRRQLERMHVWTHRRFHDATEGKYWLYWLDVRTKIIGLIVKSNRELTLDEFLMLDIVQKVADDLGFTMVYQRLDNGLVVGMGKSNVQIRR